MCYGCSHCLRGYNLQFCDNCQGCSDSFYLKNCIGCKNCFGCHNLINKEYYLFNKKLTKEEYNSEIKKLNLGSYSVRNKVEKFLIKHLSSVTIPEIYGYQNENVSGNYIYNSQNVHESFYVKECQDIFHCDNVQNIKDSMDVSFYGASGENNNLYNGEGLGHGVQNVVCSKLIWGGSNNVYYSYECFGCSDIFACTGLKKKKFCIFNRQYSEQDYHKLKDKIITKIKAEGEWGSFFPISISPFCYNETVAQEFYPLDSQSVQKYGSSWKHRLVNSKNKTDFTDEISKEFMESILHCEISGASYKINRQEYDFLEQHAIPMPRTCPDVRYSKITSRGQNRENFTSCLKCGGSVATFNTGNIVCLKCYQEQYQ